MIIVTGGNERIIENLPAGTSRHSRNFSLPPGKGSLPSFFLFVETELTTLKRRNPVFQSSPFSLKGTRQRDTAFVSDKSWYQGFPRVEKRTKKGRIGVNHVLKVATTRRDETRRDPVRDPGGKGARFERQQVKRAFRRPRAGTKQGHRSKKFFRRETPTRLTARFFLGAIRESRGPGAESKREPNPSHIAVARSFSLQRGLEQHVEREEYMFVFVFILTLIRSCDLFVRSGQILLFSSYIHILIFCFIYWFVVVFHRYTIVKMANELFLTIVCCQI